MKKILKDWKGKIDCNTVTVVDFNTPLLTTNWSSQQKINTDLNYTANHIHLTVLQTHTEHSV
jgi:hypothetical protein